MKKYNVKGKFVWQPLCFDWNMNHVGFIYYTLVIHTVKVQNYFWTSPLDDVTGVV